MGIFCSLQNAACVIPLSCQRCIKRYMVAFFCRLFATVLIFFLLPEMYGGYFNLAICASPWGYVFLLFSLLLQY